MAKKAAKATTKAVAIESAEDKKKALETALSQIKKEDQEAFNALFNDLASALECYLKHNDFDKLMREINKK